MTNLRYLRLKYKITLPEIAKPMGVSYQYVSKIELNPRMATAKDLKQLQLAIEQLIELRCAQLTLLKYDYQSIKEIPFQESQEDAP